MTDQLVRIDAPDSVNGLPVVWKPQAGFQTRFLARGEFEVLGGGAAGPGKTDALVALAASLAQHPSAKVLFLRTSYTDLRDVQDRMVVLYNQQGAVWRESDHRWTFPTNGSVELGYGASMAEISRYLGREFTAILFDELEMLPDEAIWQMLLTRIRSTDQSVPLMARASANPIGPGRPWLKERFVTPCGKRGEKVFCDPVTKRTRAFVPGTAKDNPLLPESYWLGMEDLPPSIRAALRNGDWDMALGLFFPELMDPERLFITANQIPQLLPHFDYWGAFDWGFGHPAVFAQMVRLPRMILVRDTLYMHRYQDEDQAAEIKGWADPRSLATVYAGHDAFAERKAHVAAVETVADVFGRYSINLTRANLDRAAGSKVVRRFIAEPKPGPQPKGYLPVRFVDTPGNRRVVNEMQSLVPDETDPNKPAKRDANEMGKGGDDGYDCWRYGLATPTFDIQTPLPEYVLSNVTDGKAPPAPWEILENQYRMPDQDGRVDRRTYQHRGGIDSQDSQFPSDY